MHKQSITYMQDAFARHVAGLPPGRVLDVGSIGRNAYYRGIWQAGRWCYTGLDMVAGDNVDVVLDDPWIFPFDDFSFDAVISGQMLEHNEFFWLSFIEMARVLKPGGMMIHIAPSRGVEHRAPQDCWRFYRDGMAALAKWVGMEVIEATTDWAPEHFAYYRENRKDRLPRLRETMRQRGTVWGDTVAVFRKTQALSQTPAARYVRHFAGMMDAAEAPMRMAAE
jgi:SAM-dependent methyltransferase